MITSHGESGHHTCARGAERRKRAAQGGGGKFQNKKKTIHRPRTDQGILGFGGGKKIKWGKQTPTKSMGETKIYSVIDHNIEKQHKRKARRQKENTIKKNRKKKT